MKKVNLSKTLLMIALIAMICCISTMNFASSVNLNDLPTMNQANGNNTAGNNTVGNNTATNNTANIANIAANTNGVGNNSTNTSGTLPKTGVDDTIMWVLIGASIVAALYTYKKVRDYNV